jgi:integrase
LEGLAVEQQVGASTQNQALNALVFFFREGLDLELGELGEFTPAERPRRLPVVLTREEVQRLFEAMADPCRMMAELLYGSGLRLMECVRLRVKDVGFAEGQIVVRRRNPWRGSSRRSRPAKRAIPGRCRTPSPGHASLAR